MIIEPCWLDVEIDGVEHTLAAIQRFHNKKTDFVINDIDANKIESWAYNDGPYEIIVDDKLYWEYEALLGDKKMMEI